MQTENGERQGHIPKEKQKGENVRKMLSISMESKKSNKLS